RASLQTREKARCRSLRSKDRCRGGWKLCTGFPCFSNRGPLYVNEICWGFAARSLSRFHRLILHGVVAFATGQAVFVGAAICNWRGEEIAVRRRRGRSPFERRRFPRIVVHFFAVLDAPKEIDDERNLSEPHDPRCPGDRLVPFEASQSPNRVRIRKGPSLPAVIPAPMHPGHSLQEHRKKDRVHADQRRPEMHLPPEVAHLSAGRFREPIVNAGEKPEDCARRYDVMEMRDDVVSVVQIKIGGIKRQRNAGKPADPKHWKERNGKKHRHIEANGAAPK